MKSLSASCPVLDGHDDRTTSTSFASLLGANLFCTIVLLGNFFAHVVLLFL